MHPQLYVAQGDAWVQPLANAGLAKLQFFIDQGLPLPCHPEGNQPSFGLWGEHVPEQGGDGLTRWYLAKAVEGGGDYAAFAQALRNTESYRLVAFLSDSRNAQEKLNVLARRYGVSVSHFRRLCRTAIGGTVKTELREWRTARALLTLAQGATSLTEVALELGYASSSHFSKEIRELVGVVPSRLSDITRLSSK
ncbi:helix-turn-helix domain-containing protein [Pseudomonas sp. C2L12B]|uniref:Helix-turn-helix domain-containing protein n=2 Tax=Pseudomonas typographi TaxID=2715964 RepID=A0ABR7Z219_9PSED|nr:helix-turn-helix domain-containing protein [Pseudomonas typographi]MBD1552379.1 helix-turn-helix domain-containing protein [Pseudomonas typographi]MBD1587226.1 helix-turn-helix domain-containing protein [Pseudomonas typographi]MBD1599540.1 helix-turn-helix domain-containing protein [Pseudomonas typographi]